MTLQTTTWLNLLPFTIGCLLILGFIGYAAYRGQAHIKRFPLHYAGGLLLVLLVGIGLIRTAAKPTTVADIKLGKAVTLYDKTLDLTKLGLHKEEQAYRLKLVVLYIDKKPSKALDAIFTND